MKISCHECDHAIIIVLPAKGKPKIQLFTCMFLIFKLYRLLLLVSELYAKQKLPKA